MLLLYILFLLGFWVFFFVRFCLSFPCKGIPKIEKVIEDAKGVFMEMILHSRKKGPFCWIDVALNFWRFRFLLQDFFSFTFFFICLRVFCQIEPPHQAVWLAWTKNTSWKGIQVEKNFFRFSLKKFWLNWRQTLSNLSFLRSLVFEVWQIRFPSERLFSPLKFCQGCQLKTDFQKVIACSWFAICFAAELFCQ